MRWIGSLTPANIAHWSSSLKIDLVVVGANN
jgi:hypothetical protein